MTVTELLPEDMAERGELELGTLGILPVDARLERFNLIGTPFEHQTAYLGHVATLLGDHSLASFDGGNHSGIEITHHQDGVVNVHSVTKQWKTQRDVVQGPAFNFITLDGSPGLAIFEFHHFFRRGLTETHSEPRPMDQEVADWLFKLMSGIKEPEPVAA